MELKLICCICREQIGRFDPDDIKLPLEGHMFKPIDDIHGYPPPFDPKADWNYFHCLRDNNPDKSARHRPFPHRDTILTDKGLYKVGGRLPGPASRDVPVYDQADLENEWNERANPDDDSNHDLDLDLAAIKAKGDGRKFKYASAGAKAKPKPSTRKRAKPKAKVNK